MNVFVILIDAEPLRDERGNGKLKLMALDFALQTTSTMIALKMPSSSALQIPSCMRAWYLV